MAQESSKAFLASPEPRGGYRSALVTPTYYVDLEHCRWLVDTVSRYVPEDVPHYLIVDYADKGLFAPLASSRTKVLYKEDVLRGRLRQVPFARRWWVGLGSPPVRGWIVQQLIKLYLHEVLSEDFFVLVDSGVFFVKPYDPRHLVKDGKVQLFAEKGEYFAKHAMVPKWHALGAELLGLPVVPAYDMGYVAQPAIWRRDNLLQLHRHIEQATGRPSFRRLTRTRTMSEYYIYGMHADLVLGERSGHYHSSVNVAHCYWDRTPLSLAGLREFKARLEPRHQVAMIDEKSRTPLDSVREVFGASQGSGPAAYPVARAPAPSDR